jgi:hypothetical protein
VAYLDKPPDGTARQPTFVTIDAERARPDLSRLAGLELEGEIASRGKRVAVGIERSVEDSAAVQLR